MTASETALPGATGDLLAAARLSRPWRASQDSLRSFIKPLRSFRSFAQYSRRFRISRSKPRSGGS